MDKKIVMEVLIIILLFIGYVVSMYRALYAILVKEEKKPIIQNRRLAGWLSVIVNVVFLILIIYMIIFFVKK